MITVTFFRAAATQFDYTYNFNQHLIGGGIWSGQHAVLRNISLTPTTPTTAFTNLHARIEPITPTIATETLTIRNEAISGFSYLGVEIVIPTDAQGSWVLRVTSTGKNQDATLSFSFTVEGR